MSNILISDILDMLEEKNKIKNEKLRDSMVQALSSMSYRFSQLPKQSFDDLVSK